MQADAFWWVRDIQWARLSPGPTSGLTPHDVIGARPISSWRCLPVWFVHFLWRFFPFPQECPEGWDSSALIKESRQKKPSKGWTARSPAVLQNRLLWSLPTTPARSPARPCSLSSTSPPTGATPAHCTTRLRGSGRHAHVPTHLASWVQGWARAREARGPKEWGKGKNLCPQESLGTASTAQPQFSLL